MRTEKVTDATQNIQIFHTKFNYVKVSVWCTLMVRGIMDFLALYGDIIRSERYERQIL
jgi:hypothetical protein